VLPVIQETLNVRDDWSIKVISTELWPVPVNDPERNRYEKAKYVSPRNPLVSLACGKEFVTESTPSDCLRVVHLWLLARPDVGSLNR
jgi:hypothetical protein